MSKPVPIFKGKVKNGKLLFDERDIFDLWIGQFEDKKVDIIVNRRLDNRSMQANKYLWGVVYETVSQCTGFTPEEVHEIFKKKFLSYRKQYKGKSYLFTKSTANLNTLEFSEYVEKIKQFSALELSCYIPEAGEIII